MAQTPTPHQPKLSEAELITRILAGDKNLFHDLIRPYEKPVYRMLRALLRNDRDAEDAAQDTFLKAFLALKDLRDPGSFRPWLMQIAANVARMRLRRWGAVATEPLEVTEEATPHLPRQFADWTDLPSEVLEKKEFREAVRQAIERLPLHYREVYVMADVDGLSMAEIAEALGLSLPAVKLRLHRARLRIQESLRPAFKPRWTDKLALLKGMNPWSRVRK